MGFETSQPGIYGRMQLGGHFKKVATADVVASLSPFMELGFVWKDGKLIRPYNPQAESFATPWCHARHLTGKQCQLDHQITFNTYKCIHSRCMSCWKTVVTPKNFDELMTWWKVQNHGEIDFPSKCGIELRDYAPKFYGAYHYAPSLEEGREMYEKCKELAKKHLSEETADGVILKRACTEFEMLKGPSNAWHLTEREEEILNLIENYVEFPIQNKGQDKAIGHPHVQMRWILYAHMNGDMSYLPYNNNTPLFPGYVKYHEGDINDIKHDIAILTAQAKYGHNPEMTHEFLGSLSKYTEANKISMKELGVGLGYDLKPQMGQTNYTNLYEVQDKTIGEGDVLPD